LLFIVSGLLGMYLLRRYHNEKLVSSLVEEEGTAS
jgi:hypothetical protein